MKLGEPEYQKPILNLGDVELPKNLTPLTAAYYVEWLIVCHGLPEDARQVAINNLEEDYKKVALQAALSAKTSTVEVHNHFSLIGRAK